jgi:hypothetical protein
MALSRHGDGQESPHHAIDTRQPLCRSCKVHKGGTQTTQSDTLCTVMLTCEYGFATETLITFSLNCLIS